MKSSAERGMTKGFSVEPRMGLFYRFNLACFTQVTVKNAADGYCLQKFVNCIYIQSLIKPAGTYRQGMRGWV